MLEDFSKMVYLGELTTELTTINNRIIHLNVISEFTNSLSQQNICIYYCVRMHFSQYKHFLPSIIMI